MTLSLLEDYFSRFLLAVILPGQTAKYNQAEVLLGWLTCHLVFLDGSSLSASGVQHVAFTNNHSQFVFIGPNFVGISLDQNRSP